MNETPGLCGIFLSLSGINQPNRVLSRIQAAHLLFVKTVEIPKDTQNSKTPDTTISYLYSIVQTKRRVYEKGFGHLLYLLCIFVANENDDWIYVNAVKPFDCMGCNVEQTVTVLRKKNTSRKATSKLFKVT